MIPPRYFFPILIIAVAIGYYLFGKIALGGLLAGVFGLKGKEKAKEKAMTEADVHKEMAELHKKKAEQETEEANKIHDEIINIAEDITSPDEKPGTDRTIFRSR